LLKFIGKLIDKINITFLVKFDEIFFIIELGMSEKRNKEEELTKEKRSDTDNIKREDNREEGDVEKRRKRK